MTPSRLFIVLLRVLGVFLIAHYGVRLAQFLFAASAIVPNPSMADVRGYAATSLVGAVVGIGFGLYALLGGKSLIRLVRFGDDESSPVTPPVDMSAFAMVALRVAGLVLVGTTFTMATRGIFYVVSEITNQHAQHGWQDWMLRVLFLTESVPFLVGLYMLFGGGWIVRQVERRSAMVCPVCGYDLKGLSGETCPECGGRVRIARPDPSE
jgi:hypothetical protein